MKINGITAYDYSQVGERLDLALGCAVDEALAFDASRIEVVTDAGDLVEAFAGYAVKSATVDAQTGRVTLSLVHDADGLGAGMSALATENAALKARLDDAQAQLDEQAAAIEELAGIAAGDEKEEANG